MLLGILLSSYIHPFLVFPKFLLILILYKLVNSYIFPLGKTGMHRPKPSTIFATLEREHFKLFIICKGLLVLQTDAHSGTIKTVVLRD